MHISHRFLSIPPYISSSWNQIISLYTKGSLLVVLLHDGESIHIPGLPKEMLEKVFKAHAEFLEKGLSLPKKNSPSVEMPFKIGVGVPDPISGIQNALQHAPAFAHSPPLPPEVLNKISQITRILAPDEKAIPTNPEPNCNCLHCQIAKSLSGDLLEIEESVSDEDLVFEQWHIAQEEENHFTVTNKLDDQESYKVFLGDPLGCTCGSVGCEHIQAVLKT